MTRNITLGLVVLLTSLACDHQRFEESASEDFRFEDTAAARVEVRIDDGSVDVEESANGAVEVVFRKRARAASRERARSLLENVHTEAVQEGQTIRVRARGRLGSVLSHGGGVRTDVTLLLPAATELDVRTKDGRIEIEGFSGAVDAETEDGRMRLSNVEGVIRLRTWDGRITGTALTGDVDVATDDGRIELEGQFAALRAVTGDGSIRIESKEPSEERGEWTIRTSDGSIELTLPESIGAELDATTNDGRITNELSGFEGTARDGRLRGILGSGGPRINLTTMDGRITLRAK